MNSLSLWLRCVALAVLVSITARAQTVYWTTNFYSVTGANWREIRQSIAGARPWRDGFDGDTRWAIKWQFSTAQNPGGCYCTRFATTTTITTTLPRWTPPTNIFPQVKEQWTRYFTNLAQHEAGHARIGIAAAAEIQRQVAALGVHSDCQQLGAAVNEAADKVIHDYREREKEYDRRTQHGTRPAAPQVTN